MRSSQVLREQHALENDSAYSVWSLVAGWCQEADEQKCGKWRAIRIKWQASITLLWVVVVANLPINYYISIEITSWAGNEAILHNGNQKKRGNVVNFPTKLRDTALLFAGTKRLLHRKEQIRVDLETRREWNVYDVIWLHRQRKRKSECELNYRQQIKRRFKWKRLTSVLVADAAADFSCSASIGWQ